MSSTQTRAVSKHSQSSYFTYNIPTNVGAPLPSTSRSRATDPLSLSHVSGDVSIGELMNASHKTGLRSIPGFPEYTFPQIRSLYRDMDANGDGKVTLAEMTAMIVNIHGLGRRGRTEP